MVKLPLFLDQCFLSDIVCKVRKIRWKNSVQCLLCRFPKLSKKLLTIKHAQAGNQWTIRNIIVLSLWLFSVFLSLFSPFPSTLNICCPEAMAKVLFQTCDLMFVPDQPGAFHSLFSNLLPCWQYKRESSLHKPGIIYLCSLHILCCDHDCFTDLMYETQGVQPTPWGAVGSTSTREKRGYQACGEAALCW